MGRRTALLGGVALVAGAALTVGGSPATARTAPAHAAGSLTSHGRACPPGALALGYSDRLDKRVVDGVGVGGLSSIDYDPARAAYAAVTDNHGTDLSRLWFIRDLAHPQVVGTVVLRRPDGTPYDGNDSDWEGLTVLPDGRYLISSETEPSIRIFGRDGVQRGSLPVPARLAVAPAGEATDNATLEGLTASPSGRYVYAAMEGALSGDTPATGEALRRRILVYERDHGRYQLRKQIAYQVDPTMRIAEVSAYDDGRFAVLEASFDTTVGNRIRIFGVTGADRAPDVSRVGNLSTAPARDVLRKHLVVDLTRCPSLGAQAKETQANPLMDNFEAMTISSLRLGPIRVGQIAVLSDDNFSPQQTTRIVRVAARLP